MHATILDRERPRICGGVAAASSPLRCAITAAADSRCAGAWLRCATPRCCATDLHAWCSSPRHNAAVVHFIRHGEGFHNVAGRANHDNYKSPDYLDAHLTAFGWQQAHALSAHIAAAGVRPEVVIVSPLARAIETAVGAFAVGPAAAMRAAAAEANGNGNGHSSSANGNGSSANGNGHSSSADGNGNGNGSSANGNGNGAHASTPLLMVELTELPGKRAAHPAVPLAPGLPPFVCMELCREHLGVHPCDRRRPLAEARALYPGVDFSELASDGEDALWRPDHRETKEEITARGRAFLAQLMARPEREVRAVFSCVHVCCHMWCVCFGVALANTKHRSPPPNPTKQQRQQNKRPDRRCHALVVGALHARVLRPRRVGRRPRRPAALV